MKIVLEGIVEPTSEDGGQALIARIEDVYSEFFIQLQSWSEERRHVLMRVLTGKRVRVTVETIDV